MPHDRWFSPEARSVIDRILVPDPKQRLTLAQMKVTYLGDRFRARDDKFVCASKFSTNRFGVSRDKLTA